MSNPPNISASRAIVRAVRASLELLTTSQLSAIQSDLRRTLTTVSGQILLAESGKLTTDTLTGGKGQYTQWVHCELIVGSETICLAHTQQVNGGHIQKVPTHLPSPNPGGK